MLVFRSVLVEVTLTGIGREYPAFSRPSSGFPAIQQRLVYSWRHWQQPTAEFRLALSDMDQTAIASIGQQDLLPAQLEAFTRAHGFATDQRGYVSPWLRTFRDVL